MSTDIDALYKSAKAVLWVEDPETRAWLDAVWSGRAPTIRVLVAGGRSNVEAVCNQALEIHSRNVFGLVDRDFGTSNRARWASLGPLERTYRLDVHEIENLLLDAHALAGCGLAMGKRSSSDIDARLLVAAQTRTWWFACCDFLAKTRHAAIDGFPPDPGPLASLADAEAHVHASDWFARAAAACPELAEPATVSAGLQSAHADARAALADGSWRVAFPGKQIFREVSGYVFQNGKGAGARIDLVKSVGAWQRDHGVPQQATDLYAAILART